MDIDKLVDRILKDSKIDLAFETEPTQTVSKSVTENTPISGKDGVFDTVDEAVKAAKKAQKLYFHVSLARRKKVIQAIRDTLLPEIEEIARMGYEETNMGNLQDKIQKNYLALTNTPGVEDLNTLTQVLTGDDGMTLYELCPYGVIGAIAPSTNPTETLINNAIGMLAAGNAIYFSPHPGAKNSSACLIQKLNRIVSEASGIDNLIVTIKEPSIEAAQAMMVHPDINLLVVTGGPGVVSQAMKSGKKVMGAGAGNPPTLVDETANIEKAAVDIVDGASFDNNLPCIAEKNVVVVNKVADFLLYNMEKAGAFYVKELSDIKKLEALTVTAKQTPNKKYVGKSAEKILQDAGVSYNGHPRLVLVESTPDMPFAKIEMLMPVVPFIRVPDFDAALAVCLELEHGLHHTATMHSENVTRLNKVAREMQTSIFVKNGPSFAGIGFKGEGPTTFTIATPTGEGTTSARNFARVRRCVLTDGFSIK
ncbi:aldehyde dehydrogenase family protein [Sporolactobacillus shoreicorticis]|uniref:Aldehyde dehydrogenase family protein n=1 Tax=Sporolactobacillus shoreicorticis TaxID=1923877 RepID=A0ABW5S3R4_9BACL|nr:aldehyde dehydrogenase family protein [Sporolactobacillus shoreicorticis]